MSGKEFPHPMYNHVEKYHVLQKWPSDLLELEYRQEREERGIGDKAVCMLHGEQRNRSIFREEKSGCSMYDGLGKGRLEARNYFSFPGK